MFVFNTKLRNEFIQTNQMFNPQTFFFYQTFKSKRPENINFEPHI